MKTVSLRSRPTVAREIGYLIMYVANLEIMILSILTALLGDNPLVPVSVTTQVGNITAKLEILFEIAEAMPTDRLAKAVCLVRMDIKKAVAFRNSLVHGNFVFDDPTREFQLAKNYLTSQRGTPKCEPLAANTIKDHRELLRKALTRVNRAGGSRLRNPFEVPQQA
jgi:hypothetical protein